MFNKIIIKWLIAFDIYLKLLLLPHYYYMCILNNFKVYC